ncbi:MAG: cupin [Alphaproteobacteria bacterium]|nr:cupin [Alphaproteobacteria bacterium]
MATDPGPYHFDDARLVLGPGGDASPRPLTADFYEALDRDFNGFAGHVLISRHEFAQPWPTWEMHPEGDEFVCLIEGDVDFVLAMPDGERVVRVDRPGSFVVVPRGTWHTARPRRPTCMLFVTPGEGTRNAERPE